MIISKIVDWMGFIRPSIERWDSRFDTWTKTEFEFSDVAERSPLRTPLIHHMHRSYTMASASIHQTRRATMRLTVWHFVWLGFYETWSGENGDMAWLILAPYDWRNTPPAKPKSTSLEEAHIQCVQKMMPKGLGAGKTLKPSSFFWWNMMLHSRHVWSWVVFVLLLLLPSLKPTSPLT